MSLPRSSLVLTGQVVTSFGADGVQVADAVGVAEGRVVAVGRRDAVVGASAPGARLVEAGPAAIVPGLHDFHLHLVGLARARRTVRLGAARTFEEIVAELRQAANKLAPTAWLIGHGWSEAVLGGGPLERLEDAVGDHPALLYAHDGHSAWASTAARRVAGLAPATDDPPGGRIERRDDGAPSGLLRESATHLVEAVAERLRGPELDTALDEALGELAGFGITGATDAGDSTAEGGDGDFAALGESASLLFGGQARLDGRVRLTINLPAAAIRRAAALQLRTGQPVAGSSTLRVGWAKAYLDGTLGSRTAALFEPYTGAPGGDTGILRLDQAELAELATTARAAGIGLALHAIGDRAVAVALDTIAGAPPPAAAVPPDRIEHAQLVRGTDQRRFAELGVTASLQPIHLTTDRALAEAHWADRLTDAYPWHSLSSAGALLAFGSDAPIESPNPWLGVFAAVHRRSPGDGEPDWHADQALHPAAALAAYTRGPAVAAARLGEGRLDVGAVADLAVLNVDLATLLAADERLATVRSELTLVDGHEVSRI